MSKMSVDAAMQRIKGATPDSPIMVMKVIGGGDRIDAVFASTIMSQKMLNAADDRIVGVFDQTMDMDVVRGVIEAATTPADALRG